MTGKRWLAALFAAALLFAAGSYGCGKKTAPKPPAADAKKESK